MSRNRLGTIVAGSLIEGLDARLDDTATIEQIRAGKFVVVDGDRHRFFSLITDVRLEATSTRLGMDPPTDAGDDFVRRVLAGTAAYGVVQLAPMLMLSRSGPDGATDGLDRGLLPVRTIPAHFAPVYEADAADFGDVFGQPDETHFALGKPLDNDAPVCLDLPRFVERSNGVFGKSGTGKSFLTRLLLCGLIDHDICGNLIFDMHNEYGGASLTEGSGTVKGLRDLFGSRVLIYTLDPHSTLQRNVQADATVTIDAGEIGVEDIALLARELNLNDTAVETSHLLERRYGSRWLATLTGWDPATLEEEAEQHGVHAGALRALWRKLAILRAKSYLTWGGNTGTDAIADGTWESLRAPEARSGRSVVKEMIDQITAGRHIVLEFGRHRDMLSYMLVANVLTRAIRRHYVEATERFLASQKPQDRPRQLMITIEEAHNFLSDDAARSTTFGQIAREMRKYFVTLLVVDQRPSGIDSEVLSQIGTRMTCLLDDDRDVDAVLSGVSGGNRLRSILATLEAKQQALLLGYALPMPVVIATRAYDSRFFEQLRSGRRERSPQEVNAAIRKFFPR